MFKKKINKEVKKVNVEVEPDLNNIKKAKKDKSLCKAMNKSTGQKCNKKARLGGYCMNHYIALGYKENKRLKKEKKAAERLEKQRERHEERQKQWQ